MQWKESAVVYDETDFHSGSQHQASTSQGLTKHLLVSVALFFSSFSFFARSSALFCITCEVEGM